MKPKSKKTLRRERERAITPQRAQAMHKARLAFIPQHINHKIKIPKINIGCSGWFYWDWQGKFYPAELPTKDWFKYYKKQFNTVELNAPFYSWPQISTVKTWIRQARDTQLIYTIKVSELITHIKKLVGTQTLIQDFGFIADLLGPAMGCFLFQLPPSYAYSAARLKRIVKQLDPKHRNVIEFRHPTWWRDDVYQKLSEIGIIFCAVSGPNLPDDLIKTADDIYIRFHGVTKWYRYHYARAELKIWADKIKRSGAKRIWAYFNNDWDANAAKNAKELIKLLK